MSFLAGGIYKIDDYFRCSLFRTNPFTVWRSLERFENHLSIRNNNSIWSLLAKEADRIEREGWNGSFYCRLQKALILPKKFKDDENMKEWFSFKVFKDFLKVLRQEMTWQYYVEEYQDWVFLFLLEEFNIQDYFVWHVIVPCYPRGHNTTRSDRGWA